ncbi:hypothetical protein ACJX0J_023377, partial [Zea mays]
TANKQHMWYTDIGYLEKIIIYVFLFASKGDTIRVHKTVFFARYAKYILHFLLGLDELQNTNLPLFLEGSWNLFEDRVGICL